MYRLRREAPMRNKRTLHAALLAGLIALAPALAACNGSSEDPTIVDDGGSITPTGDETDTPDDDDTPEDEDTPEDDETSGDDDGGDDDSGGDDSSGSGGY
jgi:hypothetical protein